MKIRRKKAFLFLIRWLACCVTLNASICVSYATSNIEAPFPFEHITSDTSCLVLELSAKKLFNIWTNKYVYFAPPRIKVQGDTDENHLLTFVCVLGAKSRETIVKLQFSVGRQKLVCLFGIFLANMEGENERAESSSANR